MGRLLVDTSIWVDFTRRLEPTATRLVPLIKERRIATCGVIVYELLAGIGNPEQRQRVRFSLAALTFLETDKSVWNQASDLYFKLRQKGIILPMSDVLIACLAVTHSCQVVTRDAHFSRIALWHRYSFRHS